MRAFSVPLYLVTMIIANTNASPIRYKHSLFKSYNHATNLGTLKGPAPDTFIRGYTKESLISYLPPVSQDSSVPVSTYGFPTISSDFLPVTHIPSTFGLSSKIALEFSSLTSVSHRIPSRVIESVSPFKFPVHSLDAPSQFYEADVISAPGPSFVVSQKPSILSKDFYGTPTIPKLTASTSYGAPAADTQVEEAAKGYSYAIPTKKLII